MKKIHLFLTLTVFAAAVLVGGCSDSSSGSDGSRSIQMEIGIEYLVSSGDSVVSKEADPALLSVRHVSDPEARYVTLLEGSAVLNTD